MLNHFFLHVILQRKRRRASNRPPQRPWRPETVSYRDVERSIAGLGRYAPQESPDTDQSAASSRSAARDRRPSES